MSEKLSMASIPFSINLFYGEEGINVSFKL